MKKPNNSGSTFGIRLQKCAIRDQFTRSCQHASILSNSNTLWATCVATGQPPGSNPGNESIAKPLIESATYIDQFVNNNGGPSVKKRGAPKDLEKDKKAHVSPPEKHDTENPIQIALPLLVEGAKSPREAISIYVKAAIAGDVEAALLMLDPAVRSYYQIEILSEELVMQSRLLEQAAFGTSKHWGESEDYLRSDHFFAPKKFGFFKPGRSTKKKLYSLSC